MSALGEYFIMDVYIFLFYFAFLIWLFDSQQLQFECGHELLCAAMHLAILLEAFAVDH